MSKNVNLGALSIMYVVINKRAEVIALLVKNGVQVPSNATDMQLALMVTNLLKISKAFGRDFNKLISKKEVVSGIFQGFDGSFSYVNNYFSNLPTFDKDLFAPSGTTATSSPVVTATNTPSKDNSSSPSWLAQGLNLLQTGFQGYSALDQNKTQRELANASVQIKQTDLALADKGILPSGNTPTPTGLSTGAIVGLSVLGIAVVGGVLYLALRKKTIDMTPEKLVKVIGITIGLFPVEISNLLTKNAIVVDSQNLSTNELVEATFSGLDKSISFRNDFDNLYNQNEQLINYALDSSSEYSNLTGAEWTSIGTSVVGGLGSFFGSQNNLKSAQAQADAIRQQAEAQKEVALIQMETERLKAQAGLNAQKPTASGNTILYVALGVGAVVVLGVVIFAVTRKKA